jgi:tight adherence protein B
MEARLGAFRGGEPVRATTAAEDRKGRLKEQRSYSGLPFLSAFIGQFKGSEAMAIHLERAGLPLRVGELYMIRWGLAAFLFIVPIAISQTIFYFFLAICLSVVGYMAPAMWVNGRKKKRIERINAQLVDLLGLVANSLKSGYGLMQSFEFASRQMQPPIALEIRRMLREANLGASAEDALNALGDRIDSADLDMVLTAINIQRTVGGNLAEILDKVGNTMRERERIRGEIATLTAQQKMTGIVIGGLPVFMFAIFMVMNPGYMSLLFTETIGKGILAVCIGLEFLGYFSMKRIMAIEI